MDQKISPSLYAVLGVQEGAADADVSYVGCKLYLADTTLASTRILTLRCM